MSLRTHGVVRAGRTLSSLGGQALTRALEVFCRRQRLLGVWRGASLGLQAGAVAGCVTAAGMWVSHQRCPLWLPAVLSSGGCLAGVLWGARRGVSLRQTARWLDASCGLKDRLETALQFVEGVADDTIQRLQVEDAIQCVMRLNPEVLVPLRTPREWNRGLILTAAGVLVALVSTAPVRPLVPDLVNAVLEEQSSGLQQELRALEEFQQQQPDTELKRLLESMNENLQEMAEPGTTPREAFARLSEMEASLQEMQKRISESGTLESMKAIGEAMSLAEEMSKAGKALASGDLQRAEAELSKLGAPKLDRQTERAVTDKLRQQQQQQQQQQKQQSAQEPATSKAVAEAAGRMAEGLESGDSQKFQEGTRGLASEARRMANQQKLTELLQQQAMNLAQAKSDVESQARQVAQGQGKGGKKAGKGTAGNPQGAETGAKAASRELRLSGENSGMGEAETEKSQGEQQEQVAEREYRQNVEKFEALSETALESELIPPGQKQLIRRYFQLIRPSSEPVSTAP